MKYLIVMIAPMIIGIINKFLGSAGVSRNQWRAIKDRFARYAMGIGGVSVIIAIILIFFYLIYVIFPLFIPAEFDKLTDYPQPASQSGQTMHLAIEEQNEVAVRFTDQAHAVFFQVKNGGVIKDVALPVSAKVTSLAHGNLANGLLAYGLSNGRVLLVRHRYDISYPGDKRLITPVLEYPLGEAAILADTKGREIRFLALHSDEEQTTLVVLNADGEATLVNLQKEESMLGEDEGATSLVINRIPLPPVKQAMAVLINGDQRNLYFAEASGHITVIDIRDKEEPRFVERKRVVREGEQITRVSLLTGGISLLIGTSSGRVMQWFPVRQEENTLLTHIRDFKNSDAVPVTGIVTEQRRKGFISTNARGEVAIHHSTAGRTILSEHISEQAIRNVTISPRADTLLAETSDTAMQFWHIDNEHPEISWSVLWQQVWYESYDKPDYTWQSSSASNDFEPKYSLVPLAFGTLKAAFYAMLFAVPLAIMGAIYTAYFMAPKMRALVKPSIEIMEALPTVILGFLAGLWLAPAIETNLAGVFSLFLLLPLGVLGAAWLWQHLPIHLRSSIPDGWQAAILVPVVLFVGWVAIAIGGPIEVLFFNGDLKVWLDSNFGIGYDQRNAMVVGIIMGVAVIPTIFSITEDAIFSVPQHLTYGSLALGATPWQTMMRVVLLTASPGIFSAVMIGLGRAVGETMIVLMATGNTPVMDLSIFQGMRTLSANIAVEMPESEVDSTHYRVLFLAALVLFMFTFTFNTLAEIIRHRLRKKYSSL